MFSNSDQIKKINNTKSILVGIVVDNFDPLGLGRVRVYIPNMFEGDDSDPENIDYSGIPWAAPIQPLITGGVSSSGGSFSVPDLYQEVVVIFSEGDIYHPFYIGTLQSLKSAHTIFNRNYPNMYGELDSGGTWRRVDKQDRTVEYYHSSGFKFVIYTDGNVGVSIPGNLLLNIEGINYQASKNNDNILINNLANILGGLGKGLGEVISDSIQSSPFAGNLQQDNTKILPSGVLDGVGDNRPFTNQILRLQDNKALANILGLIEGGLEAVIQDTPGGVVGFGERLFNEGVITVQPEDFNELVAAVEAASGQNGVEELIRLLPKGIYQVLDYVEGGVSSWINTVGATYQDRQEEVSKIVVDDTTLLINSLKSKKARPDEILNVLNDMNIREILSKDITVEDITNFISSLPELIVIPEQLDPPGTSEPTDALKITGYKDSGKAIRNFILAGISGGDAASAIQQLISTDEIRKLYALSVFSGIDLPALFELGYTFEYIVNFIDELTTFFEDFDQAVNFFANIGGSVILGQGINELLLAQGGEENDGQAEYFVVSILNISELPEGFNPALVISFANGLRLSELVSVVSGGIMAITDHIVGLMETYLTVAQRSSLMNYGSGFADLLKSKMSLSKLVEIYDALYRPENNPIVGSDPETSEGLYLESIFRGSIAELKVREFTNNTDFQTHRSLDLVNQDGKVKIVNKQLSETRFDDMERIRYAG